MICRDESTVVWTAGTMVEAQIAEGALREAGIPCLVEHFAQGPYDGIWVAQRGWARIRVREADGDDARRIIQGALAPAAQNEENGDQSACTQD